MKHLTYAEVQRRIAEVQRDGGATIFRTEGELKARAALSERRGQPFTDEEWSEAAANLRAFFGTLAEWTREDRR